MSELVRLGRKVRALRTREGITQAKLAERLGISASYLNLIEHDKRPLTAALLIKVAGAFDVDLREFAVDEDARLSADLMEVFSSERMFDEFGLTNHDIAELASTLPNVGRAVVALYRHYRSHREASDTLASRLADGQDDGSQLGSRLPSEEVTDLIQRQNNYFSELEAGAEAVRAAARLEPDAVYGGMIRYLTQAHGITVKVERLPGDRAIRRFDPVRRVLRLSATLDRRTRRFQLAHQIGLLTQGETLDRIVRDPELTNDDSRTLCRLVLASYFAGALLMPYDAFLRACKRERYDIELITQQFGVSFEQVCHRMTTLKRPGHEGVPFHLVKIDTAGNIAKRFSGSGIRFARFGGACPRWNVSNALLHPGRIRIQLSAMPNGDRFFCIARTLQKRRGGWHAPEIVHAIGLGCDMRHASELVYADGVDLDVSDDGFVPIGVTCRLCERGDCDQRAFPSLRSPMRVNENARGMGFYTAVDET